MRTITPDDLWENDPTRETAAEPDAIPDRETRPVASPVPMPAGEVPQYPAAPRRPGQREARAAAPRATAALSQEQKASLAILATRAYQIHADLGTHDGLTATEWRHREIATATGGRVQGLREATQRDFVAIRRHFYELTGEVGKAFPDALRDQGERADWELAWHKLEGACRQWGHAWPGYASAIAQNQFRAALNQCTTKQLWALFYTVTNRGRDKAKAAAAAAAAPADADAPA